MSGLEFALGCVICFTVLGVARTIAKSAKRPDNVMNITGGTRYGIQEHDLFDALGRYFKENQHGTD